MNEEKTRYVNASDFLQQGASAIASAFDSYASQARESSSVSMTPKVSALIELVIALVIPSRPLTLASLRKAVPLATRSEIAESIFAASALRAGGAIGYGRLAFKLLEDNQGPEAESDRSRIQRDREYMTHLRRANPPSFDKLVRFMESLHKQPLALSAKHYELMAVAGATITQCVYCLEKHVNDAKKTGASDLEIADVIHLAVVMRAESAKVECEDDEFLEILHTAKSNVS